MRVAILTLSYRLFGLESLKQKRSVVKHILAEIHRQGVAFAEEAAYSDASLHRLERRIERGDGFEVFDSEMEIL